MIPTKVSRNVNYMHVPFLLLSTALIFMIFRLIGMSSGLVYVIDQLQCL